LYVFTFCAIPAYAATTEITTRQLNDRISILSNNDKKIQHQLINLQKDLVQQKHSYKTQIDAQKQSVEELTSKISSLNSDLTESINKQKQLSGSLKALDQDTAHKTEQLNRMISSRTIVLSIVLLFVLLLIGVIYLYARNRYKNSQQTLSSQVNKALNSVRLSEESVVKSDTQLADRLHEVLTQLKLPAVIEDVSNKQSKEPDHTLQFLLADEIHRMRKRLAALPEETKGLKPLSKSLERLESELTGQGYEIVDHTGTHFTENLSVKSRFIPSDDLEPGQSIISKVVTPQINFNGVMIRMADVEVSVG